MTAHLGAMRVCSEEGLLAGCWNALVPFVHGEVVPFSSTCDIRKKVCEGNRSEEADGVDRGSWRNDPRFLRRFT